MNKTVVITGASRGIGRQTAIDFSKLGYNVVMGYNKSKKSVLALLDELRCFNPNVICLQADIAVDAEARRLILAAIAEFGRIDILVNNAGVSQQKLFTEITRSEWDEMFNINMGGCFACTQEAVKDMLKRKNGKIINVSSIWGITGAACEVNYSASKSAVIGFTKALAKELGPSGIQVNCVAPGVVDTDMNKNLSRAEIDDLIEQAPISRLGTPEDISNVILFLSSEKSDFITGQVISPNGGFVI